MRPPDATTAAGAGLRRDAVLRKGEVVGERYQILEHLAVDPLAGTYQAFDQETEAEVRLRLVHTDLLPDEVGRRRLLERLESVLGKGGRYLLPLLDADRDGPRIYVVEPVPTGATLRAIFDGRFAEGRSFRPDEVLPVVARLAAALDAVPTGFRHGDVRPGRVTVRRDGLSLSGAFLVSALPEGAVAAALQSDARGAHHAPELAQGAGPGPTTDLYGVALIALEALTGVLPESPAQAIPASLGGVGDALAALLVPSPKERATSLKALLTALARQADKPVPVLDVGVYRDDRARSMRPLPGEPTDPSAVRIFSSQPPPGTSEPPSDERSEHPTEPPDAPTGLDRDRTRRVNYPWLGETSAELFESETPPRTADVRAVHEAPTEPLAGRGRRIEGAAAGGTQEITLDQILEERERREALAGDVVAPAAYDDPFPPAPASLDELGSAEIVVVPDEDELLDTLPRRGRAVKPLPRRPSAYEAAALEGVKPIPRPKRLESILPPPVSEAQGPNVVLFDDSRPYDAVQHTAAPAEPTIEVVATITERPPAMPRRSSIGRLIVLGSLLAAVAIIAGSLLYASYRRSAADQERELRLRERYEELRRQNADSPEGAAGVVIED